MAVTQFKVGDTVRLKSGGPLMTVTEVSRDEDILVWVAWFDEKKNAQKGIYPENSLGADNGSVSIA